MAQRHWLVKTEPEVYSLENLQRDGKTDWDGVRNFQARNNLREMKKGDVVLVYHSQGPKEVVGLAKVTKEAHPDPKGEEGNGKPNPWLMVELSFLKSFPKPVHLAQLKSDPKLKNMGLIKQSRLSVTPVTPAEYEQVLELSERSEKSHE